MCTSLLSAEFSALMLETASSGGSSGSSETLVSACPCSVHSEFSLHLTTAQKLLDIGKLHTAWHRSLTKSGSHMAAVWGVLVCCCAHSRFIVLGLEPWSTTRCSPNRLHCVTPCPHLYRIPCSCTLLISVGPGTDSCWNILVWPANGCICIHSLLQCITLQIYYSGFFKSPECAKNCLRIVVLCCTGNVLKISLFKSPFKDLSLKGGEICSRTGLGLAIEFAGFLSISDLGSTMKWSSLPSFTRREVRWFGATIHSAAVFCFRSAKSLMPFDAKLKSTLNQMYQIYPNLPFFGATFFSQFSGAQKPCIGLVTARADLSMSSSSSSCWQAMQLPTGGKGFTEIY